MFGKRKMNDQNENPERLDLNEEGRGDDTETQTVPTKPSKKNKEAVEQTVRFSPRVAHAFHSETGTFVRFVPDSEDKLAVTLVNGKEKTVEVEEYTIEN